MGLSYCILGLCVGGRKAYEVTIYMFLIHVAFFNKPLYYFDKIYLKMLVALPCNHVTNG